MRIGCIHPKLNTFYKEIFPVVENDENLKKREKILKNWSKLKEKGLTDKECQDITGISRATFYRRKASLEKYGLKGLFQKSKKPKRFRKSNIPFEVMQKILQIRKENPNFGKAKIKIILQRDFLISLSESSIGRVLKKFTAEGKIQKYSPSKRAEKRRNRRFIGHAKRWRFEKAKDIGEMVQIDHMVVSVHSNSYRHFKAVDPISKYTFADIFYDAKARTGKRFLERFLSNAPFTIKSIQVDGGSEFMAEFEELCAERNIALFVLPPKSPKYNGCVERCNRTFREDFYDALKRDLGDNIAQIRNQLTIALHKYNDFRPHQSLGFKTPNEYVRLKLKKEVA